MADGQHIDDLSRLPPSNCAKIFITRDYTEGTGVCFHKKFPLELEGKIDRQTYETTMTELNRMYSQAEALSARTYCESCFACLTAYMSYICMETQYEKCLKKISRFIQEQNDTIYVPHGLMLIDPSDRGLRVLEICLLNVADRPHHR